MCVCISYVLCVCVCVYVCMSPSPHSDLNSMRFTSVLGLACSVYAVVLLAAQVLAHPHTHAQMNYQPSLLLFNALPTINVAYSLHYNGVCSVCGRAWGGGGFLWAACVVLVWASECVSVCVSPVRVNVGCLCMPVWCNDFEYVSVCVSK
ncbi:MAG: hypothetical protein P4L40_01460 [Terracidiphilus sp.]|nr:hypothetical protein [Terracidiphilus sp.]